MSTQTIVSRFDKIDVPIHIEGDSRGVKEGGVLEHHATLILSPHGHVEHHLTLTDDGAVTWIHVEPGEAKPLLAFLESMRFMLRVEPAGVTDAYAVLTLLAPAASDVPAVVKAS